MKTIPFLLLVVLIGCAKDPFLTDNSGTFKDSRDNHEYKWVRIGEQIWMAENLAYLPTVSSSSEVAQTASTYFVFDYQGSNVDEAKATANYSTYGVLYNWEAAKTACPSGWHLPADTEWKILEMFLGMSKLTADSAGFRGSGSIVNAMKSTSGWGNNSNGTNSSGFSVLPGSYRSSNGHFNTSLVNAHFWTSSLDGTTSAWYRQLVDNSGGVDRSYLQKTYCFSVRCLKDE